MDAMKSKDTTGRSNDLVKLMAKLDLLHKKESKVVDTEESNFVDIDDDVDKQDLPFESSNTTMRSLDHVEKTGHAKNKKTRDVIGGNSVVGISTAGLKKDASPQQTFLEASKSRGQIPNILGDKPRANGQEPTWRRTLRRLVCAAVPSPRALIKATEETENNRFRWKQSQKRILDAASEHSLKNLPLQCRNHAEYLAWDFANNLRQDDAWPFSRDSQKFDSFDVAIDFHPHILDEHGWHELNACKAVNKGATIDQLKKFRARGSWFPKFVLALTPLMEDLENHGYIAKISWPFVSDGRPTRIGNLLRLSLRSPEYIRAVFGEMKLTREDRDWLRRNDIRLD